MRVYRSFLLLLIILQLLRVSQGNAVSMVHRGIILEKALREAKGVCPGKITHKRKSEIVEEIKKLTAPAKSASDPHRNEYGLHDFVPAREQIQAEVASLCGFSSSSMDSPGVNMEGSDEYLIPSEDVAQDEKDYEEVHGNSPQLIKVVDKMYFLFGLASGMLVVFAYLYLKSASATGSLQVQGTKSIRRPEL